MKPEIGNQAAIKFAKERIEQFIHQESDPEEKILIQNLYIDIISFLRVLARPDFRQALGDAEYDRAKKIRIGKLREVVNKMKDKNKALILINKIKEAYPEFDFTEIVDIF